MKNKKTKLLVSIIVPTFNRGDLIGETIQSIIEQIYDHWELIIVDDGSSDNTIEVVQPFLKDDRIKFVDRPKERAKGGNAARNYGFELAKGEYVKWLDSDDLLSPNCLEKQVNFLKQDNYDVVFSRSRFFRKILKSGDFIWDRYWSDTFPNQDPFENYLFGKIRFSTADGLWRKDFIDIKPFEEKLKNSQEWLMLITQLKNNPVYIIDEEVLVFSRMHDQQKHSQKKIALYCRHQLLARYFAIKNLSKANKLTFKIYKHFFKTIIHYFLKPLKRFEWQQFFPNLMIVFKTLFIFVIILLKGKLKKND